MKKCFLILLLLPCFQLQAQTGTCVLKDPIVNLTFGAGDASEATINTSYTYGRVQNTCPTDGHYALIPYTSDCFRGDWITLEEDHTPGDNQGNMLLFNASYESGEFFNTTAQGLTPGVTYEFAVWMLNVCKPSEKCPFPLLPDISIEIKTSAGNLISELNTGNLKRYGRAQWTKYNVMFKMPQGSNGVAIKMINHNPGGCGNDFAMDDITFRECVFTPPPITKKKPVPVPEKKATTVPEKSSTTTKTQVKKDVTATTTPAAKKPVTKPVAKSIIPSPSRKDAPKVSLPKQAEISKNVPDSTQSAVIKTTPPPAPLITRTNSLVKKFEVGPGEIKVELYDNGQIDGDTVSIYHNNKLILSHVRISDKPISFTITVDANNPHHELVMVANNLGSIPPNTSLMYVTAGSKRYEVFISSNEQNNAKVVFDLKE